VKLECAVFFSQQEAAETQIDWGERIWVSKGLRINEKKKIKKHLTKAN
jgi:hypothetical protein